MLPVGDGTSSNLSSRPAGRPGLGSAGALDSGVMTRRDPHDVLGVEVGASATQIKAAWRRLARTNHPDLTGDDPAASRLATRRMAEINDAYAALTRGDKSARAPRRTSGRDAVRAGCRRAGAAVRRHRSRPVRSPAGWT